ncbi:SUMF1/EgtB/PvdO family nonheme iron enzyme [Pseudenhygromyxa sp. WMMC2535]|uniref:formylglycine-generating enzyme family protein n=1 Tax=Pseudenhygromyxa sp. WMMC2535 TaxID=2712867 RepID=UPI001557FD37|nr:SUMF1/EgtB/PvdO family nonheme iron enzyme [Pseudenhygromyxa sp. WMMC2535]NVB40627.1 SUMF1/EgtB/PvdO family nonheme iron enzyme [Pseudenhygromyxa sp. WMMC2535]
MRLKPNPLALTLLLLPLSLSACADRVGFGEDTTADDEIGGSGESETLDGSEDSQDTLSTGSGESESEGESGSADTSSESGSGPDTSESESGSESLDTSSESLDTSSESLDTSESESGSESLDTSAESLDTSADTDPGLCAGACGSPGCGDCPEGPHADVGGSYEIDATEVRVSDYALFIDAAYDPAALPETCAWKEGFVPDNWTTQLDDDLALPVTYVDWCDASAYCAWSGGHLCGRIGGEPAALDELDDGNQNEWYRACSNGGTQEYPYGDSYDTAACNGTDLGVGEKVPVGSLEGCEGGVSGIFDMSGNVWEWTSACESAADTPDNDEQCRYRGGSYFSGETVLRCAVDGTRARDFRNSNTGIRCCY